MTRKHYNYNDWGRLVPNSKKDLEIYRIKNGEYKIHLSSLWKKSDISKMSSDRYSRYLLTCLYGNLNSRLLTEDKQEADLYVKQIQKIYHDLYGIEESDEFWSVVRRLDYHLDDKTHELIFTDNKINYSKMNRESMINSNFELTLSEQAYLKTSRLLWLMSPSDVCFNQEENQLELEIPVELDLITIQIPEELDFHSQFSDKYFIVELDDLSGQRKVKQLNVSKETFNVIFAQKQNEILSQLPAKVAKRKKNKRISTNFSENPGICTTHNIPSGIHITGDDIKNTFGLDGVYGNYLSGKDRRRCLEKFANALFDLAKILQVKPADLSLPVNGNHLAISLAARGSGRAAGHYEPLYHVVNLTKATLVDSPGDNTGGGIFAHEWGHALDHFLSIVMSGENGFLSDQPPEDFPEFSSLISYLNSPATQFSKDALALDAYEGRKTKYWSSTKEKFARGFNSFIVEEGQNIRNDFLAFNFNAEIKINNRIVSANPKGEDLRMISSLFIRLFDKLKKLELFHQLEEADLVIQRPFPLRDKGKEDDQRPLRGKQIAFF